ncbi:MAG: ParM/StbA family protein [Eubacteriales bacterium]|nr:ParM/StbA family protein [Eubacteriales bacterium]
MADYIAVDCGKFNTKVYSYDSKTGGTNHFRMRTRMSEGTFEDDMFGRGTMIVQVDDGPVYKIGGEAKNEPDMESSKKTEIHRVCTLAAMAMAAKDNESDEVNAVIGMPLQMAWIPEERIAYKNFIFGEEGTTHTIRMKPTSSSPILTVSLRFNKRVVYPEGIGVLYAFPEKINGPTAIIDIGNLNINNTYADGFTPLPDACFTDELGGKGLIMGLAQELSSELGMRCDDNLAASTLLRPYQERFLRPKNGNKEIQKQSIEIIDGYLLEHVKAIKKKCDTKHWPLDFMDVICVGGTSRLLQRELRMVFGENLFIPEAPEFVNAQGFLMKLCADADIDLTKGAEAHAGK